MGIWQKFRFRSWKQHSNLGLTLLGGNILVPRLHLTFDNMTLKQNGSKARGCCAKFATGLNIIISQSSKSI